MKKFKRKTEKLINDSDSKYFYIYDKLLNLLMFNGKKFVARRLLNKSLEIATLKLNESSKKNILLNAISNVAPDIEVKSRRIGSSLYQVPVPLDSIKKLNLGIRFLLEVSRTRKEYQMVEKLGSEIVDAYNNKGLAIKKKEELHKLAETNKSFSHFNW